MLYVQGLQCILQSTSPVRGIPILIGQNPLTGETYHLISSGRRWQWGILFKYASLLHGMVWFACSTIHFRKDGEMDIAQSGNILSHTTRGKVAISGLSPRGQWEILFKYALLLDGMDWFACSKVHFRKDAEMDIIQNGGRISYTTWGKVVLSGLSP